MLRINLLQFAAIVLSTFLMSLGQFFWKLGLNKGALDLSIVFNIHIWFGGIAYIGATLIWFWLLKQLPLSLLYPFTAVSFIFGYAFAVLKFNETIQVKDVLGLGFIALGLFLIAKTHS